MVELGVEHWTLNILNVNIRQGYGFFSNFFFWVSSCSSYFPLRVYVTLMFFCYKNFFLFCILFVAAYRSSRYFIKKKKKKKELMYNILELFRTLFSFTYSYLFLGLVCLTMLSHNSARIWNKIYSINKMSLNHFIPTVPSTTKKNSHTHDKYENRHRNMFANVLFYLLLLYAMRRWQVLWWELLSVSFANKVT